MALVYVGMSGGVDSSVAACLLQQQGYQVEGVFMQNWDEEGDDPFCPAQRDLADARAVCAQLDIPLHTVSFAKAYWDHVFEHFLSEYAAGRTPNPDILCNREIKFSAFLDYAIARGADYIATGHYARILNDPNDSDGEYRLLQGIDPTKDQSYFLYTLQQKQLARSLFPIGSLLKTHVRDFAHQKGLVTHAKKDSVGICFIGERNFRHFLQEYLLARPGTIENEAGESIGQHQGLMFYTLGQRQGLGIGGRPGALEAPWYVLDKDIARNVLVVGQGHDHPRLLSSALMCQQLSWVAGTQPTCFSPSITAKTRYRQQAVPCQIIPQESDVYRVEFDLPVWGVTPGQSIVFYEGEVCLGGGVIG